MKILMIGRGVISTQYGWAFEKAGHTVNFYVRPGRAAKYGSTIHLNILDARKKLKGELIEEDWKVRFVEEIPENHNYDLIIISVQHYQFAETAAALAPKVGKATVLIFNNFWTDPLQEVSAFPKDQLAWGFPQAGGGFDANGALRGGLFADVQFGTFGTEPTKRELAIRDLFLITGFKIKETKDFKGWLWIHFAVDAGFFAKVLEIGSTDVVFKSNRHLKNAILNVRELLKLVEARGINLNNNASDVRLYMRPLWLGSLMIRALLKISPPFRLLISSHANPEEARSYGQRVLEMARSMKFSVPRLEAVNK
jgi:2-dehydropantoate 2-reductase